MDDISRELPAQPEPPSGLRRGKGPHDAFDAALGAELDEHDLMTPARRFEVPDDDAEARRGEPVEPRDAADAADDPGAAETDAESESEGEPSAPQPADDEDLPPLTDPSEIGRVCLAILLSSREPLTLLRLAQVCNASQKAIAEGLESLQNDLASAGLPIEVACTDDHVRLLTKPEVYPWLRRLVGQKKSERLSAAALETLAVIAYRQPVMRAEIEAIRGVKVGPMLRTLLEHKLVDVVGRADVPGRPLQYGTTQVFLDRFGLRSLKDLPSLDEFRSLG